MLHNWTDICRSPHLHLHKNADFHSFDPHPSAEICILIQKSEWKSAQNVDTDPKIYGTMQNNAEIHTTI